MLVKTMKLEGTLTVDTSARWWERSKEEEKGKKGRGHNGEETSEGLRD